MASVELRITEEWIRERLNLRIDCLADVRSLALPGSYHEKVTHLSRSLVGFTRLKQLDLSRNALRSLEGLEHLKMLETLNVYYNNISGLHEVFRLRHNAALKELDLRLNPVTKEEPDYRLFVVHMLVHLRTLDDRPVKESERKAALMHFDTDQAYEMMLNVEQANQGTSKGDAPPPVTQNHIKQRTPLPQHVRSRQVLVKSLAPRPADETTNLLELLNERDQAQEGGTPSRPHNAHRVLGSPLKASSEIDAAEQRKVVGEELPYRHKGHFTPHPQHTAVAAAGGEPSSVKQRPTYSMSPNLSDQQSVSVALQLAESVVRMVEKHTVLSAGKKTELQRELAHWFSSNQALSHPRYELEQLSELQQVLHSRENELARKEDLLARKEEELVAMVTQLEEQSGRTQRLEHERSSEERRRRKLEQAERDLVAVQDLVQKLRSENSTLRTELQRASKSNESTLTLREDIERLRQENAYLQKEAAKNAHLQAESEGLSQMKQLVTMLQESHHSLLATNAQLLREVEEAKERHAREVEQMHTNYEHLRKTVDIIHST